MITYRVRITRVVARRAEIEVIATSTADAVIAAQKIVAKDDTAWQDISILDESYFAEIPLPKLLFRKSR